MNHANTDLLDLVDLLDFPALDGMAEGIKLGCNDMDGSADGISDTEGNSEGLTDGASEGASEGFVDGMVDADGMSEGASEGRTDGKSDGVPDGLFEGFSEGRSDGSRLGCIVVDGLTETLGNREGISDFSDLVLLLLADALALLLDLSARASSKGAARMTVEKSKKGLMVY
ncbi:hypothetical protein ACHAXS_003410, partial [Conticribra weissflogii]